MKAMTRLLCWSLFLASCAAGQPTTLYSSDPNHIWNRVHRVLNVRVLENGQEYGSDEIDPLLWRETKYLIAGKPHRQALAILDEFLSVHAERLITDPLRRAIFQHDLWTVFDWSDGDGGLTGGTHDERRALQVRLAQLIRRVALSRAEIERLPDNLADAAEATVSTDLPFDLLRQGGPWVCVYPRGGGPAAPAHSSFFSRSVFFVLVRLPGGRQETLSYLARLSEHPDPWLVQRYSATQPPVGS